MKINKKEIAFKIMFDDPTQYVSKTTIENFTGYPKEVAQAIFDECKRLERLKTPEEFDGRPKKVQKKLVFKVTGLDYNFSLKQYREKQIREEANANNR